MSERQGDPNEAQRRHLLAAILGVVPLYSTLVFVQFRSGQPLSLRGFEFYLAVASPLAILITLVLLRFLCGERPGALNLRSGTFASDLVSSLILSALIIVVNVFSTQTLSDLLPTSSSNTTVRDLFLELANNPGLLALFLGLLIPLGAASEEVVRVFLLSRLWQAWPSGTGKAAAVAVSACWFGIIHVYRGPAAIVSTGIIGLIMALHYLRNGRVLPLILAHYLTNATQVVVFCMRAR